MKKQQEEDKDYYKIINRKAMVSIIFILTLTCGRILDLKN